MFFAAARMLTVPTDGKFSTEEYLMSFFYDAKREQNERKRGSDTTERRRNTDSNRDGDSQRNRSDRDVYGPEEI